MKNIPIWQDVEMEKDYPCLNKGIDVDVLIIGGGITGCSTFYQFKDVDLKVALVEKNKIGYGATSRSSAKITFLQEDIYTRLNNIFGRDKTYLYYKSQKEALKLASEIVSRENISCDFKKAKSCLYTFDSENIKKIEQERLLLSSFGEKVSEITKLPNGIKVKAGFALSNTYIFQPLKFVRGLLTAAVKDKHDVYEKTKIIKIEKDGAFFKCYSETNVIRANYVVLALHYPYFLFPYLMPLKVFIEKSYLGCSKVKDNKDFTGINIEKPLFSFRYYKNYLLTVSASSNLAFGSNDEALVKDFKKNTGDLDYEYLWNNHDLITWDHLPLIGFIDENLLLATGYNTWGNSNSLIAGLLIKDLILGKDNQYQELFDPKRGGVKMKAINYPINIFSSAYSFISSKLNKNKSFYNNNPYFTKRNGRNVAIYKDEEGIEHVVYNRCPHLKCGLVFNKMEKTWDCPCHGSRFDLDGKCIMGPSNYDIGYK